jgi:hypothetical protein
MRKNVTLAVSLIGILALILGCARYVAEQPLKREAEVAKAPTEEKSELKPLAPIEEVPAETEPSETKEVVSKPSGRVDFKGFFNVYTDRVARDNHYVPSGWMGDYGDLRLIENWAGEPHSGKTCIRIEYSAKKSQGSGWAGIYWQNPPNNWGTIKGGYNLTGAKKLTFWARGEKGGEVAEFKMGGITGEYPDSASASAGVIELTKKWKMYTMDLTDLDLSYISGGFCWVTSYYDNPNGCVIYLDDIKYE